MGESSLRPLGRVVAGYGLIAATILVLSNLAGIAVDFFFLLIDQIVGSPGTIANLAREPFINVAVCLLFMVGATFISYRDMQTTQKLQYFLVTFQVVVLVIFAATALVHVATGGGFDPTPFEFSWFDPFAVGSLTAVVAGLSLSIFIFWGWDVTLTMNEETKDPERTPGRAATIAAAIVASAFYTVMRLTSEDALWDTILALGLMICFYYGITAFACVWYFRKQWFDSVRMFFFTLLFPLVGGVALAALFVITLFDSMDPGYGSGTEVGGIGIVFVLGMIVIGLGLVLMVIQRFVSPAFFRGETLAKDAPPSLRRRR